MRVSEALAALASHATPLEEVHLVANRIPVLPGRAFGSLMVSGYVCVCVCVCVCVRTCVRVCMCVRHPSFCVHRFTRCS